jgi:acyl-phosphate glycerol 3-phosphate acyltransferase
MGFAWFALMLAVGYLSGSVNYAIIVTRARTGADIRELGNRNAGTANVGRTIGRGWGAMVYFCDFAKALLPLLAARLLFFTDLGPASTLALFAVGMAAIVGHCRPVFFGFRGGGGIATSMPVYLFFIPVEFTASVLLAALLVALFVRHVEFRLGRWVPILFVTIAPFLTLGLNKALSIPLTRRLSIGGHPWSVLVGVLATSVLILIFNTRILRESIPRMWSRRGP